MTRSAPGGPKPKPVKALGPGTPVTSRLFGMHDHDPIGASWPAGPVGSIRLWDSGVTWRQVETSPGTFRFGRLDRAVATARAHGADVLLVLGMSPQFHAKKLSSPSFYGDGASSPPKLKPWKRYVRAVATRYRGQGVSFQVWNEANVVGFWNGSQAEMARLTKATYDVLQAVSPGARLVAPAYVTRTATQQRLLDSFYGQTVDGRSMASLVDVASLQLYPTRHGTPEDSMQILATDRAILARHGVRKPLWTTEINYGLDGSGQVRSSSAASQRANVARTYLLNAANGIDRVYWYAWDLQNGIANTRMTSGGGLSAAGLAFRVVEQWMVGTSMHGCDVTRGVYLCTLTYPGGVRRVYWSPRRTTTVTLPAGAKSLSRLDGRRSTPTGSTLQVGSSPVMVESKR